MAESYDETIKNMSERAKSELYNMQSRAMPPMPSFVRTPSGGNVFRAQNGGQNASRGAGSHDANENSQARQNTPSDASPTVREQEHKEPQKKGLLGLDILKILDAKGFSLDSDRILLLLLIVLLSGEGGDEILIFALAYLML